MRLAFRLLAALSFLLLLPPMAAAQSSGSESDSESEDESGTETDSDEEGGEEAAEAVPTPAPVVYQQPAAQPAPTVTASTLSLASYKGGGPFGLGIAVGSINGLSLKVWPTRAHGIVLHVGVVPRVLNSLAAAFSYRIHFAPTIIPDSPVLLNWNLGPTFRTRIAFAGPASTIELAGGVTVSMSVSVRNVPAEIYFDVAPLFAATVRSPVAAMGFDIDGVVGARFYFGI